MDFKSKTGTHHLLIPIGYGEVQKIIMEKGDIHDAHTQYEIHTIAQKYNSNYLMIPKCISLTSHKSYTMKIIYDAKVVPPHKWPNDSILFTELLKFYTFMMEAGYFPKQFTVLQNAHKYCLIDFSHFGIIQKNKVYFPKNKHAYTIEEALDLYGLQLNITDVEEDLYNTWFF